jgi:hypothetical protein
MGASQRDASQPTLQIASWTLAISNCPQITQIDTDEKHRDFLKEYLC